jgi:hypothetical protein
MLRKGRHAFHRGTPINWKVTIVFGYPQAGDELEPQRQFQDIRKRVRDWWDYRRKIGRVEGPFVDWRVVEAPGGKVHVDWQMHIPDDLQEEARQAIEDRCRKVLGGLSPETIKQQVIYNSNGAMRYALEGTEPEYARQIKIDPKDQGQVWGRRAAGAMCLGAAARARDYETQKVKPKRTPGLPLPREMRALQRQARTQQP